MVVLNKLSKIELAIILLCIVITISIPGLGVLISFAIVFIYLLSGKKRKQNFKSIGFVSPDNWLKTILISIILAIVIQAAMTILAGPLIDKITNAETDLTAFNNIRGNWINYLLLILVGWLVGGFIEEILFRGFLITRISKFFSNEELGNWIAIIITSFIFGFSHLYQGWDGVINTGLTALLLGIIFIKSGKILWYSIITHGFINVIGLTLIYLEWDKNFEGLLFN